MNAQFFINDLQFFQMGVHGGGRAQTDLCADLAHGWRIAVFHGKRVYKIKNILLFIGYFFHAAVSLSIPLEHVFGIIPYYIVFRE